MITDIRKKREDFVAEEILLNGGSPRRAVGKNRHRITIIECSHRGGIHTDRGDGADDHHPIDVLRESVQNVREEVVGRAAGRKLLRFPTVIREIDGRLLREFL